MKIDTKTIDLDALAALEAAATAGPWSGYRTGVLHNSTWVIGNAPDDSGAIMSLANASLIAALRNHAPALIAAAQERDALLRHLGPGAAAEHNVLALLDLYEERTTKAEAERDAASAARDDYQKLHAAELSAGNTARAEIERLRRQQGDMEQERGEINLALKAEMAEAEAARALLAALRASRSQGQQPLELGHELIADLLILHLPE